MAETVPGAWVGQVIRMNVLTGVGADGVLGVTNASGNLEAANAGGLLLSDNLGKESFIPWHAVLLVRLSEEQSSSEQQGTQQAHGIGSVPRSGPGFRDAP